MPGLTNSRMPDYFQQKMSGILPENSGLFSDPDHLDVLKSPFLENERLQPAHHAVFAVEKVGLRLVEVPELCRDLVEGKLLNLRAL